MRTTRKRPEPEACGWDKDTFGTEGRPEALHGIAVLISTLVPTRQVDPGTSQTFAGSEASLGFGAERLGAGSGLFVIALQTSDKPLKPPRAYTLC